MVRRHTVSLATRWFYHHIRVVVLSRVKVTHHTLGMVKYLILVREVSVMVVVVVVVVVTGPAGMQQPVAPLV